MAARGENIVISDERAEKSLRFLAETDEPAAQRKADMERAEYAYKRTREAVFTHLEGTVADRQAGAVQHAQTQAAHEDYVKAIYEYQKLANKRDTEKIVLDTWRTIQANRRQG